MGELALKIFDPNAASAAQAPAAVEAPQPAPGPRLTADPLELIPSRDLVPFWPDGDNDAAKERGVRRFAEKLAQNPASAGVVEKVGNHWYFSPLAPDPTMPPESGSTLADFLFVRTGRATHDVLGVYVPQALAEQIPTWTLSKRARFFAMCELVRQLREHEERFAGLAQPERDRLFRADAERQRFCTEHGVTRWSARSVREFRRDTERGIDWDQRGRPRYDQVAEDTRCTPEAWDHFKSKYLDASRKSVKLCWILTRDVAEKRGWTWPKERTIARRVKRELPPSVADYTRLGPRRWEAKYQTYIQRDRVAQYAANECWICDHTRENFWSISRGRWVRRWLTIWVDAATGRILSWARSLQPNSDIILATFYHAVRAHGAPLHVTFDNGKDFRARSVAGGRKRFDRKRVDGVMGQRGIGVTYTEPYHGESKGVCEREFGVFGARVWKLIPTYCGANPGERPETLNADLKAGRISVPTEEEIDAAYTDWVEARNYEPREALGGRSPVEHYETNAIPRRTAPDEILAELCLPETDCVVGRLGVQVRGHWYGQDELRLKPLFSQRVRVRFDPLDAERVSVFDREGRFVVHRFNRRLRGVNQDDIREAKHRKKAAVKLVKEAHKVSWDSLASKTTLAQQVAAQRRYVEGLAAQRIAVGAAGEAEPRGMQLLPGAAEAAASLAALRCRSPEQRSVPSAAERLARLGGFVETPEPAHAGFNYSRFAGGCPDMLGTPSMGDEPREPVEDAGQLQFRLLHELGDDSDWQPPPGLKARLDEDDFAPDQAEAKSPVRNVLAELAEIDDQAGRGGSDA